MLPKSNNNNNRNYAEQNKNYNIPHSTYFKVFHFNTWIIYHDITMTTRPHNVCNSTRTTHKLHLIPSTTKISIKSTYIFQDGPPPQDWCASAQHEISHFNLQVSSQCIYITAKIPHNKVFGHFKHASQKRQFTWVASEYHYSTQYEEYHNTKFFS